MVRKYDTVIFDLDSTIVAIEGLSWLASKEDEVHLPQLHAALEGRLPLQDALQHELTQISPSYADMLRLGAQYKESLIEDAADVIDTLHSLGKEIFLISNNFHPAIDIIASHLGIPLSRTFGMHLMFDEKGMYHDFESTHPLAKNGGKAEIIKQHIHPDKKVVMVGDSVPDLEVQPIVDLFIGFGGVTSRPSVKNRAHVYVQEKNLTPILDYILDDTELQLLSKQQQN